MASAELSPSIKITLQLMRPDTGNDWVFCRPIGHVSDIGCVHVKATRIVCISFSQWRPIVKFVAAYNIAKISVQK